jgi:uncharacterized protein YjbI with pentapeptide repeats
MAIEEQVERLRQGVDVWNSWREANPEVVIDLSGAKFLNQNLAGVRFFGSDPKEANLQGINLHGADLSGATFGFVNLTGAILIRANLTQE